MNSLEYSNVVKVVPFPSLMMRWRAHGSGRNKRETEAVKASVGGMRGK